MKPSAKSTDITALSAVKLIELLKKGTKSAKDLFKTIPLNSPVWQNQQLIDIVLLTHRHSFVEWLQASSFFEDMQDANCIILAHNVLPIIKELIETKNIYIAVKQAAWVQKLFFNLCTTIAKEADPIAFGNKNRSLLKQLIQIILSVDIAGYIESTLNQQFHQSLNLPHGGQIKSFTPLQLLVVLKHTQALAFIADKNHLDLKTQAQFNIPVSMRKQPLTLNSFAMHLGFKEFAKVHQLSAAKAHLKEIEGEKPWIDFVVGNSLESMHARH